MKSVYELFIKTHISSGHFLRNYPGDCANLHGHNWLIEVAITCEKLDSLGIGIDFRQLKKMVKEELFNFDHKVLNELPDFENINPTSENLARILFKSLSRRINREMLKVSSVKIFETPDSGVIYREF